MQRVAENIYVGSKEDLASIEDRQDWAIVHACKTSHKEVLGYEKSLPGDHPSYLVHKEEGNIYLNMVDMAKEFLPRFTDPIFQDAFEFIEEAIQAGKKVYIYCDQGMSRSPSVALAYLSRKDNRDKAFYPHEYAEKAFRLIYPAYEPGTGIKLYLQNNWNRIMRF